MVREFFLENEKGEKYSLMDIENFCLLINPSGLGYTYLSEFEQISDVFVLISKKQQQNSILGNCVFRTYENFTEFVNFIEQSSFLKIIYNIPYEKSSKKEFLRDIVIQSLEKGEKDQHGNIIAPITFICSSLWYERKETIYSIETSEEDLRWDFFWDSYFESYDTRSIVFNNIGHTEAPLQFEIFGLAINPVIEIYKDGKKIQSLKINTTIEEGEKLYYSSKDNDLYLYKSTNGGELSLIEELDINNNNFFKLPKGISEIKMRADNDITQAKLNILIQYRVI